MLAEFEVTTFAVKGQDGFLKLMSRKNLFSHASFVINALRELKTSEKPFLTLNNRALFHHLCFILLKVAKNSHKTLDIRKSNSNNSTSEKDTLTHFQVSVSDGSNRLSEKLFVSSQRRYDDLVCRVPATP